MAIRRFIDLNLGLIRTHTFTRLWKERTDEFWQNDFRSTDGLCSLRLRLSLLCGALSRQLQGQEFFLLGSVSYPGLCTTYLSRESQRHRSVSARSAAEALSHGHSKPRFSQHPGQRQSGARLENLRGFCSWAHPRGTQPLPQRTVWPRTRSNCLRIGCHHHRSLPVTFSLGSVPPSRVDRSTRSTSSIN